MLKGAVQVGHETQDVAIGAKVNLYGQREQALRINNQLIEMQDLDIKESDNLLGEIQRSRRKNKGLLCCVSTMLIVVFVYIILVEMGKIASIFE